MLFGLQRQPRLRKRRFADDDVGRHASGQWLHLNGEALMFKAALLFTRALADGPDIRQLHRECAVLLREDRPGDALHLVIVTLIGFAAAGLL